MNNLIKQNYLYTFLDNQNKIMLYKYLFEL